MARPNAVDQLVLSEGAFGWNAASTTIGVDVRIPLFIKDMSIPSRRAKLQEIHTTESVDPRSSHDTSTHLLFSGAPEPLQVSISGWLITRWTGTRWDPYGTGSSIYSLVGNINNGELISYLLEGRYTRYNGRAMIRRDPDYFRTPYGHEYTNPVIFQWEYGQTNNPRKQTFSATVYLER